MLSNLSTLVLRWEGGSSRTETNINRRLSLVRGPFVKLMPEWNSTAYIATRLNLKSSMLMSCYTVDMAHKQQGR